MSTSVDRTYEEFWFGDMLVSVKHLNDSSYGIAVVLKEDEDSKWTLFEVSGIGEPRSASRLMLRHRPYNEEGIIDRYYKVDNRTDALDLVDGYDRMREHLYITTGVHVYFY